MPLLPELWMQTDSAGGGGGGGGGGTTTTTTTTTATTATAAETGVVVDNDTLEAVKARWLQDQTQLPALFTQPVRAGRLKSAPDRQLQRPYAQASSVLLRREKSGTSGHWHDHRRVTIKVWGVKADVVNALDVLQGIFNVDLTLAYPSGARFVRWWPDGDARLYQDETTKDGEDIWVGEIGADVWSVRSR